MASLAYARASRPSVCLWATQYSDLGALQEQSDKLAHVQKQQRAPVVRPASALELPAVHFVKHRLVQGVVYSLPFDVWALGQLEEDEREEGMQPTDCYLCLSMHDDPAARPQLAGSDLQFFKVMDAFPELKAQVVRAPHMVSWAVAN